MKKINDINFTLGETLTDEQMRFYNENGFLQFSDFISIDHVLTLRAAIEEVQRQWIEQEIKKVNGTPLIFGYDENGQRIVHRFAFASLYSEPLHDILKDIRLKAFLGLFGEKEKARIGENERDGMVINHYVNTPKSQFTKMGWHTDSSREIMFGGKLKTMFNIGLHLDDCPFENGGLRIIPGTHKQSNFKVFFGKVYYLDNSPDKREMGFNIKAGDLTLHNGHCWHRVAQSPHTGEKSRRRVIYVPVITGKYNPKNENTKTPLYHKLQFLVKK